MLVVSSVCCYLCMPFWLLAHISYLRLLCRILWTYSINLWPISHRQDTSIGLPIWASRRLKKWYIPHIMYCIVAFNTKILSTFPWHQWFGCTFLVLNLLVISSIAQIEDACSKGFETRRIFTQVTLQKGCMCYGFFHLEAKWLKWVPNWLTRKLKRLAESLILELSRPPTAITPTKIPPSPQLSAPTILWP